MKLIIFAPHPDDEAIGTTGKIYEELKKGTDIFIVYITNGSKNKNMGKIRKDEAIRAMSYLGVKNLIFLNNTLYPYLNNPKILKSDIIKISNLIKNIKPNEIYVPAYEGGNFDHDIVNYMVNKIVKDIPLYEYPTYNNYLIFILIKILRRLVLPFKIRIPQLFIPKKSKTIKISIDIKLKDKIIRFYKTQNKKDKLVILHSHQDKFRLCPKYNYLKKPHIGPLHYEIKHKIKFSYFKDLVKSVDSDLNILLDY